MGKKFNNGRHSDVNNYVSHAVSTSNARAKTAEGLHWGGKRKQGGGVGCALPSVL